MRNKLILTTTMAAILVASFVMADWHQADFNNDGVVSLADAGIIRSHLGQNCSNSTGNCDGTDMNYDGIVNIADIGMFSNYLGCNQNSSMNSTCWN